MGRCNTVTAHCIMEQSPDGGTSTLDNKREGDCVRRFTWKELSQLNRPENAHVAVRGKVYDVSGFVARHPGGMEQIMLGAGRDITQVFESYHSFEIYKVLEKYYVGELVDNEMPVFPQSSEFYKVLKNRVENYFKENNIDPKIDYWLFLRCIIFFAVTNIGWIGTIYFHENYFLAIASAMISGFFGTVLTLFCTHDASHFSVTHKPWVWKVIGLYYDFFYGLSIYIWIHQHTLGHHIFTNIDRADPDTLTKANHIRRIKWSQSWLPRYIYQHLYTPLLYGIVGMKSRLQDFHTFWTMKTYTIRLNPPFLNQWIMFWCGKIFYVTYRFILPAFFVPWYTLLLTYLVFDFTGSYFLITVIQFSHVNSDVEWLKADEDNTMHMDWAEMQVATTQDYATRSWFWTVFTGYLNHQTAHHLFPAISQSHYPHITPIVEQACKEYGIKYHYVDTIAEAFHHHIRHLKTLGQSKEKEE